MFEILAVTWAQRPVTDDGHATLSITLLTWNKPIWHLNARPLPSCVSQREAVYHSLVNVASQPQFISFFRSILHFYGPSRRRSFCWTLSGGSTTLLGKAKCLTQDNFVNLSLMRLSFFNKTKERVNEGRYFLSWSWSVRPVSWSDILLRHWQTLFDSNFGILYTVR